MAETILLEWYESVAVVTLNRPDASNALNPDLLNAICTIADRLSVQECRAVVLTGAGRNFCAGADLRAATQNPGAMDLRRAFHPALLALATLEKPVIAAINGAAAGGGLGLALAADIRIMAEDARLVPAWSDIGLVPDLGASWFVSNLIGEQRAFEWFATGDTMDAGKATALGVAREKVAPADLLNAAISLAQGLAEKPGQALTLTKHVLSGAGRRGLAEQIEREALYQTRAANAPGRMEQVATKIAAYSKDKPKK